MTDDTHNERLRKAMSEPEEAIMLQAVWMYYDESLTQQEIADKLQVSRVSITRLLKQARERGIVQFQITKNLPEPLKLSRELQKSFGLKRVIIAESQLTREQTLHSIGKAGAKHLDDIIEPGIRIGFGWSGAIGYMGRYIAPRRAKVSFFVNDLAGHMLGRDNPYSIGLKVAEAYSCNFEPLSVPMIMQDDEAKKTIIKEPHIERAFRNAERCDVAFVGVGAASSLNTSVSAGYISEHEMTEIRNQGAIGEILIRFYNREGNPVSTLVDDRAMTLNWKCIKKIPYIVVLAVGSEKVEAIAGSIRARICHCLITDTLTAKELLSFNEP